MQGRTKIALFELLSSLDFRVWSPGVGVQLEMVGAWEIGMVATFEVQS